jgi:predicted AAA+ superfamily ATPase
VVLIVGPRRAGKTTLVRKMGEAGRAYIALDDQTVLEAAQSDPAASFAASTGPSSTKSSAPRTCC